MVRTRVIHRPRSTAMAALGDSSTTGRSTSSGRTSLGVVASPRRDACRPGHDGERWRETARLEQRRWHGRRGLVRREPPGLFPLQERAGTDVTRVRSESEPPLRSEILETPFDPTGGTLDIPRKPEGRCHRGRSHCLPISPGSVEKAWRRGLPRCSRWSDTRLLPTSNR